MKKIIIITLLLFTIFTTVFYLFMLRDTNNIVVDFTNVVSGKRVMDVEYGALERYDYTKYFQIKGVSNVTLKRTFVFHNFKKGYMNVIYSYEINNGNENNSVGASKVHSRWYIEKKIGRWKVIEIDEKP